MPEESKILSREVVEGILCISEDHSCIYLNEGDQERLLAHDDSLRRERDTANHEVAEYKRLRGVSISELEESFRDVVRLTSEWDAAILLAAENLALANQAIDQRDAAINDRDIAETKAAELNTVNDQFITDITVLQGQRDAAIEARTELQARKDALYTDCMIAHRWFSEAFGDGMNGRDFALKVPMARERMAELLAAIEAGKADKARLDWITTRHVVREVRWTDNPRASIDAAMQAAQVEPTVAENATVQPSGNSGELAEGKTE